MSDQFPLRLAFGLTACIALVIGYGTLSPPGEEGSGLPFSDKQLHFMAFAMLVLPLGALRPRWALRIAALALLYGGAIELIQPIVGRVGDWPDMAANTLGVVAGLLPGQLIRLRQA